MFLKALLHCAIFSAACMTMLKNVSLQVTEFRYENAMQCFKAKTIVRQPLLQCAILQ